MKTQEERAARRAKIKAFFQKVAEWLKMVELKIEGKLPAILDSSLKIMQWFKLAINNQIIDLLVQFTPTQADDIAVEKIRAVIEKVIDGLMGGKYCIDQPSFIDKLKCFIEFFKTLPKDAQSGYFMALHTGIIQGLSDDQLTGSQSAYLASKIHLGEKLPDNAA